MNISIIITTMTVATIHACSLKYHWHGNIHDKTSQNFLGCLIKRFRELETSALWYGGGGVALRGATVGWGDGGLRFVALALADAGEQASSEGGPGFDPAGGTDGEALTIGGAIATAPPVGGGSDGAGGNSLLQLTPSPPPAVVAAAEARRPLPRLSHTRPSLGKPRH